MRSALRFTKMRDEYSGIEESRLQMGAQIVRGYTSSLRLP